MQYFLADSPKLKPFSPSIICFNPTIIESIKKTLGDLPKTDRIDLIADMQLGNLVRFLIEKGNQHFEDADAVTKKFQAAVKTSYRLAPSVDNSLNLVLRFCIENLHEMEKQKKAFEKSIKGEVVYFENEYTCLKSKRGKSCFLFEGEMFSAGAHRPERMSFSTPGWQGCCGWLHLLSCRKRPRR